MKWLLSFCLIFLLSFSSNSLIAQSFLDLPGFDSNFARSSRTRGFWFTAPDNFTITGLRVPTDVGTDVQNIQVVRFNSGVPPEFSGSTTDFTTLFLAQGTAGTDFIDVNIPISNSDVIGILGSRGTTTMNNSYGSPDYTSTINGMNVTLTRLVYQDSLNSGASTELSSEIGTPIGRVEVRYGPAEVPTLSEWGLIILALSFMTLGTLYLVQPSVRRSLEQE